ncbi:recombinase family protein [Rickettsia endosymbiont of Orchestes rusci]|uniref:recombinase family protein n=1 Tax=Rickettsia endosymbiont of Orchestes rusci TaxID=3066250 RepID=UPI00313D1ABF
MSNKAIKAIILSRVSSRDQEDGYSLEVQEDRLEKYCERKNLQVVERFKIVESSSRGDRKQFMEVIKCIKKQREPIALIIDKVDRLQRRQTETPILDELIKQGRLELHFNSEGYVIDQNASSHQFFMWGIGVVFAKSQTDLLSETVKKSLKHKVEVYGEWFAYAPFGYLNARDERGRGVVVPDPINAPIIKKLFEEYATGNYTLGQLVIKAKAWGLRTKTGQPIAKSVIHRLIQNPFYYGEMRFKGEILPHCHETIITKETFKACEAVRMGWNKKPFQYRSKEFLFRGILKCAITGKVVTSYTAVKKYKSGKVSEWNYLRTWKPEEPTKAMEVREDEVIEQVEDILKSLKIKDPEILKQTMDYLKDINRGRADEMSGEVKALREEHTKIQNKLDSLVDLVADGVLTREEFLRKKSQLKERQCELSELIKSYDGIDDKLSKKLLDFINVTTNAYEIFKGSTISEKREFLNFIFSNLELKGCKVHYSLRFPFDKLQEVANCPTWRRGGDLNP